MNPQLQEILNQITTSIQKEFEKHEKRIEELEKQLETQGKLLRAYAEELNK